jgi:hypothetical protein
MLPTLLHRPGAAVSTKKSVLVVELMLRAAMGTLLGHDVGAALAPPDPADVAASRSALQLEVLAFGHPLQVLQRSRPRRLRLARPDRWLWVALSRVLTGGRWQGAAPGVRFETGCSSGLRGRRCNYSMFSGVLRVPAILKWRRRNLSKELCRNCPE